MGVVEKIAELAAALPPAKQAAVLDFVEFLASRTTGGRVPDPAEWTDAAFQKLALCRLADDDDPVRYDLADCKETR
jgi:hypothetical protein